MSWEGEGEGFCKRKGRGRGPARGRGGRGGCPARGGKEGSAKGRGGRADRGRKNESSMVKGALVFLWLKGKEWLNAGVWKGGGRGVEGGWKGGGRGVEGGWKGGGRGVEGGGREVEGGCLNGRGCEGVVECKRCLEDGLSEW